MKYARKVISLLLAMVMALSLTTGVWAENGSNDDITALRNTWKDKGYDPFASIDASVPANAAALKYVYTNYAPFKNGDGKWFLEMNGVDSNDVFFATEGDQVKARNILNSYTSDMYAVLDDVVVGYGYDTDAKFSWYVKTHFAKMLGAPLLRPEGGTGSVTNIDNIVADGTYVTTDDVTNAKTYFKNHFSTYYDDAAGTLKVGLRSSSIDNGVINNREAAKAAIDEFYQLFPRVQVALNQLKINVSDAFGQQDVYFWQLISRYQEMLQNNGGGNQPGGNQPVTGDKAIDELTGQAATYVNQYIDYTYNNNVTLVRFKNAAIDDKTGLYADENARKAAIAAYDAYLALNGKTKDALNELFVTDDKGNYCWFSDRVEALFVLAKNQPSGTPAGSISDADAELNDEFRKAGYKAPTLGVDFRLEFSQALALGTDYDYTYNSTTGHLIVTVKAPTEGADERWLQAAAESYADGLVLCQFYCDNVMGKQLSSSWCGNGNEGWTPYLNGNINFEGKDSNQVGNGMEMAIFNTVDDVRGVSSVEDDGMYRFVAVWANQEDGFPDMDKYMLTFEVKTESSFYFEEEGIEIIDKVNPNRVHLTYASGATNCFTERKNEIGALTLQKKQEYTGNRIGTFTVDVPEGYTLDRWEEGNSGNRGNSNSIPLDRRNPDSFYAFKLIWRNSEGNEIAEELTIYVAEMGFAALGSYDENGTSLGNNAVPVNKPSDNQVNSPNDAAMTVSYDENSGFFYTSFDNSELPTYQQLSAGVTLTPPDGLTGVTHFRVNDQDSNDHPGRSEAEIKKIVAALYTAKNVYALNDPDSAQKLIFPYVHTNYKNVNGVNVSYAGSQAYRFKIVQWLHYDETRDNYEVLGYSYVSGRNDAFINKTVTPSVSAPTEDIDTPFIIGANMEFCCNRYPQMDGDDEVQYFRFHVRGEVHRDGEMYKVYIPYAYFGMTKEEGLARAARGEKPVIYHYYGNHELRGGEDGTFYGQYTEYGIYFEVSDFSPFVVDCSAGSNSGSGSSGGSGHRVTTAVKADSPATFDAGIALYGALAISSLTGMAYVGKKKF